MFIKRTLYHKFFIIETRGLVPLSIELSVLCLYNNESCTNRKKIKKKKKTIFM